MMTPEEWVKSEAYADTDRHALESTERVENGEGEEVAIPANAHVAFGLLSGMQILPMGQRIMWALSDGLQKDPELAAKVWEIIEDTVRSNGQVH